MRSTLLSLSLLISVFSQAYALEPELKLGDLKTQNAVQLSKDELQALLPGAKVKSVTSHGSTRYWENGTDGKFVASADGRGKYDRPSRGHGTWNVGDNATFCVNIEWKTLTEQWCRFIFKAGDKYYAIKSLEDDASPAHEISFTK